jgi:serine/threonine protein kinase
MPISVEVPGFEILAKLAEGGMGNVYRGRDPVLGRELAIKVMKESVGTDLILVRRFVAEAQIGGQHEADSDDFAPSLAKLFSSTPKPRRDFWEANSMGGASGTTP